jgi:hypothetical protein
MKTTALALLTAALFSLLTACGGGTSNPAPDFPDPVAELTEADLLAGGLPALPADDGTSAVRGASGDFDGDSVVDAADYVLLHNLTPTTDGFVTEVPEDTTSRVIAWVLYRIPGEAGDRSRSLIATDLIIDPMLRVFAAVSNFSTGRWEPLSRSLIVGTDGGIWKLSAGQRYNRQNGDTFLLLALGHPGHGEMSGYSVKLEDVLVSSFSAPQMRSAFEAQTPGGANFGQGFVEYAAVLRDDAGEPLNRRLRQQFLTPADLTNTAKPVVMFPQPLNLDSNAGTDWFAFQQLTGDWNGDGDVSVAFYDPAEANGPRHAYRLGVWDDTDIAHVLGVVPLQQRGGDHILIGMLVPAPPAGAGVSISVDPATDTPERVAQTNARGEFELANMDDLSPGNYVLGFSWGESQWGYAAKLMEEEGIYYFLISPEPGE